MQYSNVKPLLGLIMGAHIGVLIACLFGLMTAPSFLFSAAMGAIIGEGTFFLIDLIMRRLREAGD